MTEKERQRRLLHLARLEDRDDIRYCQANLYRALGLPKQQPWDAYLNRLAKFFVALLWWALWLALYAVCTAALAVIGILVLRAMGVI
jgi:hypothetical protein